MNDMCQRLNIFLGPVTCHNENGLGFLLQMGLHNVELYNNLGLSCFYAQQYDMSLACMEKALEMANDESLGNDLYSTYGS